MEGDESGTGCGGGTDASETILLAEDQDDLRELLRETLEERGYTVLLAADGQEAVDVAAGHTRPHRFCSSPTSSCRD